MSVMPRVLIAPDKFKGSLTAAEVAAAVARGLTAAAPDVDATCLAVADGGDGTLDAAIAAGFHRVETTATGPSGTPRITSWAERDGTALIEMASVSGLAQLHGGRPDPLGATSRGTGELIREALDAGCSRIVVGIGGSASNDGGAGMASALGALLTDCEGRPLAEGGAALSGLAGIDLAGLHPGLATTEVVVACDVDNPLLGARGAAAVYGPQKGASVHDVERLDKALATWAGRVALATARDDRNVPGAGAAGGVGFAAVALLGARLEPGIDLMLDLLAFDRQVQGMDLVVTGEGSLDGQSLHGKAPLGVARAARAAGVKAVAVCGRKDVDDEALRCVGIDAAYALTAIEPDIRRCMTEAATLLEQLGATIAVRHLG